MKSAVAHTHTVVNGYSIITHGDSTPLKVSVRLNINRFTRKLVALSPKTANGLAEFFDLNNDSENSAQSVVRELSL